MQNLVAIITSPDPVVRNQSLDAHCRKATPDELLSACAELDAFRRRRDNLYERVRALFFLFAIHRFHLPGKLPLHPGSIPWKGCEQLLHRRFEEAIDMFLDAQRQRGPSDGISSALASAYHRLAFQTLADQVRRSVRSVRGNQWMFRMGHPADQPLRIRSELLQRDPDGAYPILREQTPVRMDLTHSAWSDIFFLGMDCPEGAKVLNVSIDLGVHGRDASPRPPVSAWLRVIDEPLLRLTSVDLAATTDITALADVFDFARDYLGLLKASMISSGLVPPGIEGSGQSLAELLARVVGPGHGIELVSCVNGIPKGSRLAVSTNLLGSLISVCMRATGQAGSLTGPLQEHERQLVLARALLGEWLGGSGGGWQDSAGVWPGMKLIEGVVAAAGDPEFGISRGRLMPRHRILHQDDASPETRRQLQESLVLVHGGMAQNVGPILEMVTEKYLLRTEAEWQGRQDALRILDEVLAALKQGDIRALGTVTTRNFRQPIATIIPWATNAYTETLLERISGAFGADFWGFWMLGGMSGGGMGFIFAPEKKAEAQRRLPEIMGRAKRELERALPFAMEPVVFDYAINERGTLANLLRDEDALMPANYYTLTVPALLKHARHELPPARRAELDKFGAAARTKPELREMVPTLFDVLLPRGKTEVSLGLSLATLLEENGFDRALHEQIRADLKEGRIGLAQNRLPQSTVIEDVGAEETSQLLNSRFSILDPGLSDAQACGLEALRRGEVGVVTLAAGSGSRWTQGAGVVKALHPFCKLGKRHRTFIETHLAKSRHVSRRAGAALPHIFTTSCFTHEPTAEFLSRVNNYGYEGPLFLSPGKAVGLRLTPTEHDLRFLWEEMPQQLLDEQQQKVRDSLRAALVDWARSMGEASDYTDNLPMQCLHPVGHWYEVPNLLRNGVLAKLLMERPRLQHLLLHNIDAPGVNVDPTLLGQHMAGGGCLTFEVITRCIDDRGGGLARVNGRLRLVEGLALPREEEEFTLSYYNSNSCWIHLDKLLAIFGLTRQDILDSGGEPVAESSRPTASSELGPRSRPREAGDKVTDAVRALAAKMPTYVTIKEVKKRWGHGQEDVFPVTQFEKLWVDMTALLEVESRFVVVPRLRGQQLKDQSQLDGWLRDGSAAYAEALCDWT